MEASILRRRGFRFGSEPSSRRAIVVIPRIRVLHPDPTQLVTSKGDNSNRNAQLTVPPQGPDLILTSDIPNSERDVLVLDGLDVETYQVLGYIGGSRHER